MEQGFSRTRIQLLRRHLLRIQRILQDRLRMLLHRRRRLHEPAMLRMKPGK